MIGSFDGICPDVIARREMSSMFTQDHTDVAVGFDCHNITALCTGYTNNVLVRYNGKKSTVP